LTKKLEKLAVDLVANGEKFKRELAASQGSAERWGQNVKAAVAKGSGALLAAGVATAALTVKTAKLADEIAKNIKASGLGAETYQSWEFAASQAGVSNDKFSVSIERATKRIGEAARGYGGAKKTLDDYNISVFDARGNLRTTEDVLREFADRLSDIDSQAERTAAVTALFGREGIRMGLVFQQGSEALLEFEQRARDLGLVIDRDILQNAEAVVDELDIMERVIKARLISAMGELFPTVISIGNAFAASTPKLIEFTDAFLNLVTNSERAQISNAINAAQERIKFQRLAISQIEAAQAAAGEDQRTQARLAAAKVNAEKELAFFTQQIESQHKKLRQLEIDERKRTADLIDAEGLAIGGGGGLSAGGDGSSALTLQRQAALHTQSLMDKEAREIAATEQRNQRLLDLSRQHTEQVLAEEESRAQRILQIEEDLHQNKFNIAQDAAFLIGSLAEDGSGIQKAAFVFEKILAIARIRVNTELAAVRALAELGPVAGPPAAAAIRAQGIASQVLVGATAVAGLSGQAHSGLTNVPNEGTYLLQRGERVVQPKQNEDLSRFLASQSVGTINVQYIEAQGSNTSKTFTQQKGPDGLPLLVIKEQIRQVFAEDMSSGRGMAGALERAYRVQRSAV
jgi:hypothetical protein